MAVNTGGANTGLVHSVLEAILVLHSSIVATSGSGVVDVAT